jgi:arylsulfatase
VPQGFYSSEFYTDKIIEYIEEQKDDQPFFAYLAFTGVHDPLHLPDEWLDKYKDRFNAGYGALRKERLQRMKQMGLVPEGTALGPWLSMVPTWDDLDPEQRKMESRRMEIYAAMVENVDFHIGRLLDYLKKSGHLDDTLVIFFSDNGANGMPMHAYPGTDEAWVERNSDNRFENWGRRGSRIAEGMGWAQASVTPFRLFKGFIAEGGIRSPLIVSGPGVERAGEIETALAHVMDLAPTFIEIAGGTYPDRWEGREVVPVRGKSMLPLLTGKSDTVRAEDEPVGWELLGWRAIRMGQWKITWIDAPFGTSSWQLFDLSIDPGETKDLHATNPEQLGRLMKMWDEYEEEVGIIYAGEDLPISF